MYAALRPRAKSATPTPINAPTMMGAISANHTKAVATAKPELRKETW